MPDSRTSPSDALRAPVEPPLLFFAVLVGGVVADWLRPLALLPDGLATRLATGLPFFALAVAIGAPSLAAFRRSDSSPRFGKSVTALVRRGPYRFSRNPLYLALLAVVLGFAFLLDNAWLAIGVPILFVVLDRLVIRREERFLLRLFGDEYVSYCERVRRWL